MSDIKHIHLVAGGFHDVDYARLPLRQLIGEDGHRRTTRAQDYGGLAALAKADMLITRRRKCSAHGTTPVSRC